MKVATTYSWCCLLYQAFLRKVGCVVFKHPIFPSLVFGMLNPKSLQSQSRNGSPYVYVVWGKSCKTC
jgi:hypothetical protein